MNKTIPVIFSLVVSIFISANVYAEFNSSVAPYGSGDNTTKTLSPDTSHKLPVAEDAQLSPPGESTTENIEPTLSPSEDNITPEDTPLEPPTVKFN